MKFQLLTTYTSLHSEHHLLLCCSVIHPHMVPLQSLSNNPYSYYPK